MCGLAGVIAWDERYRVSRALLEKMSARVAHRGPDGKGVYVNHERPIYRNRPQCGLAHRRLAVLDLDQRSLQPFDDGNNSVWVVYNGEIYNYREIRAELAKLRPDYKWRTTGDTEVLLVAYDVWRERCVEYFNGMFAFAVWDERDKSLLLARDRMGQKPLYYAIAPDQGAIAFASELGALRELDWVDTTIDFDALGDYLRWGYIPSPRTIYLGAGKLPPAYWMRVNEHETVNGMYFDPNAPGEDVPPTLSNASAVETTRRMVTNAVQRQLVSDVSLGCFLSGGVDSSIVAAAMKAAVPADQTVMTFCVGFEDERYDETPFAAAVARHLGTRHQEFIVRPDAANDLPKLAAVFGEPFADSSALPTHYLARETRQDVKVALSGDGGDELFGGYDRYRAMAIGERVRGLPRPVSSLMMNSMWQKVLPGRHPKALGTRVKRMLGSLRLKPARRYAAYMRLMDYQTMHRLMRFQGVPWRSERAGLSYLKSRYQTLLETNDVVQAALALDRVTYLPEDLLTKVDRCSMLHALEVRSPFMDHDLVHFAATLSTDRLIGGGGKRMLREAFAADLPPEVFKRKKMGFAVPIGEWLRDDLRDLLRDAVSSADSFTAQHFDATVVMRMIHEHEQETVDHSQRLYALLMLELWWRTAR